MALGIILGLFVAWLEETVRHFFPSRLKARQRGGE